MEKKFFKRHFGWCDREWTIYGCDVTERDFDIVVKILTKIRAKEDFPFWAFTFAKIKNKNGGEDIPFKLNRPQRRLVEKLERMRKAHTSPKRNTMQLSTNFVRLKAIMTRLTRC